MKNFVLFFIAFLFIGCNANKVDEDKVKDMITEHLTKSLKYRDVKIEKIKINNAYNVPKNNRLCHFIATKAAYLCVELKDDGQYQINPFQEDVYREYISYEYAEHACLDTTQIIGLEVYCKFKHKVITDNEYDGINRYVINKELTNIITSDLVRDENLPYDFNLITVDKKLKIMDIHYNENF